MSTPDSNIVQFPVNIYKLGLKNKTLNALETAGYGKMSSRELCELTFCDLIRLHGIGEGTYRDLIRGLLRDHYTPKWLKLMVQTFKYNDAETCTDGDLINLEINRWKVMTFPFKKSEWHYLERLLADLERDSILYRLVRTESGISVLRRDLKIDPETYAGLSEEAEFSEEKDLFPYEESFNPYREQAAEAL